MKFNFKNEITALLQKFRELDKKIVTIFVSIALLQAVSFHFASTKFFYDAGLSGYVPASYSELYANLYWFGADIILLFIIPALIILFYFREKIQNYGLVSGSVKTGLKLSLPVILLMALLIWFVSASEEFTQSYPSLKTAADFSLQFLIYEIALLIYLIAWEFIWRGYMLFGLEEKFGYYAVFIQMIPFVIMHAGKPFIEMLGAIPGGIFLGVLALRTRSIFYGVIIHFFVMLFIDAISILRLKSDDFGVGIGSLINIFSHLF